MTQYLFISNLQLNNQYNKNIVLVKINYNNVLKSIPRYEELYRISR